MSIAKKRMNIHGDCLVEMAKMEPNSVDAIVTDPPYGLKFMGKEWDYGLPGIPFWAEAIRVAKPGCHLLAFGGTRTFHRLACAIEDAGWEIRDTLMYVYGSGFPKSESVSLAIDKKACRGELEARLGRKPTRDEMKMAWEGYRKIAMMIEPPGREGRRSPMRGFGGGEFDGGYIESSLKEITAPATDVARQWQGWGTALKPAWEPIILARKPLDGTVAENVQKWGCGSLNIDGCRVGYMLIEPNLRQDNGAWDKAIDVSSSIWGHGNGQRENPNPKGRWPANLIHDGSDEVLAGFPNSTVTGNRTASSRLRANGNGNPFGGTNLKDSEYTDSGSAARFFYCAKASRAEREMGLEGMPNKSLSTMSGGEFKPDMSGQNHNAKGCPNNHTARNLHPTVKPLALMRYLCRLVTPPNGLILDPFMGSGTTGMACKAEGFRFIGIDNNAEYVEIAKKRINAVVYEPKLIPGVEATL